MSKNVIDIRLDVEEIQLTDSEEEIGEIITIHKTKEPCKIYHKGESVLKTMRCFYNFKSSSSNIIKYLGQNSILNY